MDPVFAFSFTIAGMACGALVMIGTFISMPNEHCTRFWAAGSALNLTGAIIAAALPSHSTPLFKIALALCLCSGFVSLWWGLQAFYRKPTSRWGWVIGGGFLLAHLAAALARASDTTQVALSSALAAVAWVLCFTEVWRHRPKRLRFAEYLTLASILLLFLNSLLRLTENVLGNESFSMLSRVPAAAAIFVLYVVPMVGTLLCSVGIALLYFERLVEQTNYTATHDELTGLLNRRAIVASGLREMAVARRTGQALTVAFVDIDHFKHINDAYGHDKGDLVLREVARLLGEASRADDMAGRYGGEEFCVIFPGVGRSGAPAVGERLVSMVRQHRASDLPPVTISVGLAILDPQDAERSWDGLVHQADVELYRAKASGRDQYRLPNTAPGESPAAGILLAVTLAVTQIVPGARS